MKALKGFKDFKEKYSQEIKDGYIVVWTSTHSSIRYTFAEIIRRPKDKPEKDKAWNDKINRELKKIGFITSCLIKIHYEQKERTRK
jgi:hypothetical protein